MVVFFESIDVSVVDMEGVTWTKGPFFRFSGATADSNSSSNTSSNSIEELWPGNHLVVNRVDLRSSISSVKVRTSSRGSVKTQGMLNVSNQSSSSKKTSEK